MCAMWAGNEQKSESYVKNLLTPIRNQFVSDGKGGIAGYDFAAYDDYLSAIESYIRLNAEIPEPEKFSLISDAVWVAAKANKLDEKNLLDYVTDKESDYLSKPKEDYEFFSSISVRYFNGLNRSRLKPPIKFSRKIPETIDFESILEKFSYIGIKNIPESYTFFRIPLKARNPTEAYRLGIDAIDLLRAIWNWYYKPQEFLYTTDQSQKPMNLITLGPFHSVLKPDGALSSNFWYESEFQESTIDIQEKWEKLSSFERKSRKRFSKHPYKDEIEDSLRRFTQALDHRDKNVSFLQLWQVLEKITGTNNANYDRLIKRVSFLYEEVELNKGVLNHLRLHRNSSVHDGKRHDRIEKYLYQLKSYVQVALSYHIDNPFNVKTMSEAHLFLDMPTNCDALRQRLAQTKKALKYRKGP